MSPYDQRFWEVCVDPSILSSLSAEDGLWYQPPQTEEDEAKSRRRQRLVREAVGQIRIIIETHLTDKQREIVELYFFRNKTQEEIAEILGISQQVVSKHLFGAIRNGRRVGGAVRKLRKICRRQGIDPQKWV